jgi:hypothetical protein
MKRNNRADPRQGQLSFAQKVVKPKRLHCDDKRHGCDVIAHECVCDCNICMSPIALLPQKTVPAAPSKATYEEEKLPSSATPASPTTKQIIPVSVAAVAPVAPVSSATPE